MNIGRPKKKYLTVSAKKTVFMVSLIALISSNSKFRVVDDVIKYGAVDLVKFDDIKLKGRHNQENVIAALELVSRIKDLTSEDLEALGNALKVFAAGEHRVEKVLEHDGITFIDDSKGTNPAAVVAAINSVPGDEKNILLILGGLDKGMDFSSFAGV